MPHFENEIDRINHLVDEIEEDIDLTTRRIEACVDQLDELALKVARASKVLREHVMKQRVSAFAGRPTTTH
jgi:peptidoglycan hydrolase CwlO-like protein